jgi:hypothetical protein
MTTRSPKVFISYSHDGPEHEEMVLDLADRLRDDGVDAEVDQYLPSPLEGWPAWCERQIENADFVLMVCTETYHRRVQGGEAPGRGLGVVWEARIIRQLVYDSGAVSTKFIPVLFSDGSADHIPLPVKGWTRYVVDTKDGYEALYRRLTDQPWTTRPPLGQGWRLPSRPRRHGPRGGGASGAARERISPSQCHNWAKLLNREPQETAIVQRLEAMRRTSGRFEPLLVVIPGCASACHEHFLERVGWHELGDFVRESGPARYEQLVWRPTANDIFILLYDLRDRLETLSDVRDIATLEARLRQVSQSICFSFSITDWEWRANRALVRAWIDYFCRSWPRPAEGHLVVAFLCVDVPETCGTLSSWLARLRPWIPGSLAAYLENLKALSEREPRLLVTPPLEPIRRKHVIDWIGRIRPLLPEPEQVDELRDVCRELFPEPDAPRPFLEVHREILGILHDITGAGQAPGMFAR